jgi:hypothetical protein
MSVRHLEQNASLLNRAAWKWLKQARAEAPPHYLHVLNLAAWGLEEKVEGEWPSRDQPAVEEQVYGLFGWKPDNVLHWLVSNPNGPDTSEQMDDLVRCLHYANGARQAAALVLSVIYSRQQAENPALQP